MDWKNPNYLPVYKSRLAALGRMYEHPEQMPLIRAYYREHIPQFISDWGMTVDPREADLGRPTAIPFVLFDKQVEWMDWVVDHWHKRRYGLTEKSRDMGISWCAVALACSLCLFNDNIVIGFGSRKAEYVDKIGAPKSLFYKARFFISNLPAPFRGDWNVKLHGPEMRISFPGTGSVISGEGGDSIGRGDRASIYFVDEAAHLEHPELVDAALSNTTNCRMDMSSVAGMGNTFAQRRHSGKHDVFVFDWRHDPRKDDVWYEGKKAELDPVVLAQEVDRNYNASAEGVILQGAWVQAAVNAHVKLGIKPSGLRTGALDVADRGKDKNAMAFRHGILLESAQSWSGANIDLYKTTEYAFTLADAHKVPGWSYDGDGLGAGIRGDAKQVNIARVSKLGLPRLRVHEFRASDEVLWPEKIVPGTMRTNEDYYQNFKAQCWGYLKFRFQETFKAINGQPYDPDNIISIDPNFPEFTRLLMELSQPVWKESLSGKLLVDKTPDDVASPNLADAVMMAFAPRKLGLSISQGALDSA